MYLILFLTLSEKEYLIPSVRQEKMLYKKNRSCSLSTLIARRLMGTLSTQKQLSRLARICFLSSAIIACAFTVALAIMNGFHQATCSAFQNIHADIIIQSPELKKLAVAKIAHYLETEFKDTIHAYAPYSEGYAIARSKTGDDLNHVVYIQGIDPEKDLKTRALAQTVTTKTARFQDLFSKNRVVIGQLLATDLGVKVGDTITLLFVSNNQTSLEQTRLDQITVTVSGICKTGLDDLDTTLLICNQQTFEELFPSKGITTIGLKLKTSSTPRKQIITALQKRFSPLEVYPWIALYPALEAAFRLEQIALIIIALLICLIASTNLMSLILLFISNKQQTIATLRAMGTSLKTIKRAFMLVGSGLVMGATVLGLLSAAIICFVIEKYELIALPDAYYISHIPAQLTVSILVASFLLNMLCGILATWWATRTITQLPLSTTLKGESL